MTNIQRLLKIPTVLLGTALLATSCAGTVGSAGATGAQGPAGPQGPQGLTGAIGSTGPQGPAGPQGPQGLAGAQGPRGFSGSDGSQGANGLNGLSAYQIYIAEYPAYVNLGGANTGTPTRWINDLSANALYQTITFNYATSGSDYTDNFTANFTDEPANFKAYKGQTYAQYPLVDLFETLTKTNPSTASEPSSAQYIYEFFTAASRQPADILTNSYVYGSHTTIFVKATLIAVTSIVLKNEIDSALNVTATVSGAGFALTVPKETVAYAHKFTHYLATANADVKTDGIIYSDSGATTELVGANQQTFLKFRDGAVNVGSNSLTDLLTINSPARSSFGIWQLSGDAESLGKYLSFFTETTLTVYLKIIFSDESVRIMPLVITVAAADTTAPTTTFSPADSATNVARNSNITITFNEAVKLADGTILENSDLASIITLKQTNSSGTDIPFTATINAAKTVITIDPTTDLTASGVVYVEISDGVQDTSGNTITAANVSFTAAA
jgi:hypothetical protein